MILNNKFYINNLKTVVIYGGTPNYKDLITINDKLGLKTILITSSIQKNKFYKDINKDLKLLICDKVDKNFKIKLKNYCKIENTLFLVVSAMNVFSKEEIIFFKENMINFFPSRLPYDAGRGGFSWHIMRSDKIYNQVMHVLDEGINTGPIVFEDKKIFPNNCNTPLEYEIFKLKEMNIFYEKFVKKIIKKENFLLRYQPDNIGRYNPPLNSLKDGFVDWSMTSFHLYNFIRAFDDPHIGAATFLDGKKFGKVFLKSVHLHGGEASSSHPYLAGVVSRHDGKWIVVNTTDNFTLLVEKILNKKGENILKSIEIGQRFFTPTKFLELSKSKSTIYTTKGIKK
jgi:methionyl-tRNA formyltransferase